jgi:hypothetical protein
MPHIPDVEAREQPMPPDESERWHLQKGIPVVLITGLVWAPRRSR